MHSAVAMRIGPGGKAQPLHRDDYIAHNVHTEVMEWDDARDMNRESAVGCFVAGCRVTPENGGTNFIPGSHLWQVVHTSQIYQHTNLGHRGNDRKEPPDVKLCIQADMEKGDAFFMLASAFHGGGANITKDEQRLVFGTFVTRGYLRQEENQFLAVPPEVARQYPRDVLEYLGYSISDPACGTVDQLDPIYALYPEWKKYAKYKDF